MQKAFAVEFRKAYRKPALVVGLPQRGGRREGVEEDVKIGRVNRVCFRTKYGHY